MEAWVNCTYCKALTSQDHFAVRLPHCLVTEYSRKTHRPSTCNVILAQWFELIRFWNVTLWQGLSMHFKGTGEWSLSASISPIYVLVVAAQTQVPTLPHWTRGAQSSIPTLLRSMRIGVSRLRRRRTTCLASWDTWGKKGGASLCCWHWALTEAVQLHSAVQALPTTPSW